MESSINVCDDGYRQAANVMIGNTRYRFIQGL
jgi:hypothetical protein